MHPARPSQIVQDGAVRSVVPLAAAHQGLQGALHGLHGGDALGELVDVALRDALDLRAGAAAVVPQGQQGGDFFDGEAQVARAPD